MPRLLIILFTLSSLLTSAGGSNPDKSLPDKPSSGSKWPKQKGELKITPRDGYHTPPPPQQKPEAPKENYTLYYVCGGIALLAGGFLLGRRTTR